MKDVLHTVQDKRTVITEGSHHTLQPQQVMTVSPDNIADPLLEAFPVDWPGVFN